MSFFFFVPLSGHFQDGWLLKKGAGRLLDYDHARITKTHYRIFPGPGLEDTADDFPIEEARLRSALYLVFFAIIATIGYGWAIEYRVVCPQAGFYSPISFQSPDLI